MCFLNNISNENVTKTYHIQRYTRWESNPLRRVICVFLCQAWRRFVLGWTFLSLPRFLMGIARLRSFDTWCHWSKIDYLREAKAAIKLCILVFDFLGSWFALNGFRSYSCRIWSKSVQSLKRFLVLLQVPMYYIFSKF